MYKTVRCIDSRDTGLRQYMIALYILQEHTGHLWSMLGTELSIFKLYIFTIPCMPCIINLEMLNCSTAALSEEQRDACLWQWPEHGDLIMHRDLGKWTPLNLHVCMLIHLHVIFKQTSFNWNWTKRGLGVFFFLYIFYIWKAVDKKNCEKVMWLAHLNLLLINPTGLDYIFPVSLVFFWPIIY